MEFETIIYKKENGIARVIMNRPKVKNAQNHKMVVEMDQAFNDAEQDTDIRVVVLSGTGNTFSSGHDMTKVPERAFPEMKNTEERWNYEREFFYEKIMKTWRLKKPVIAQVQGYCLGAGFMLANMCDLVIASEDAKFGDPVIRMGASAVEVFCHPWVLPPRIAKEILFTGNTIDAAQAYQYGMVNKVVPLEDLENETMDLATQITKMPPFAVRISKNSVNRSMDMMGFNNALNAHFDTHVMSHFTDEAQELMTGAREKSKSIKDFIKNRDNKF